ncbi:peptidoglycan-binding protein [Microbaculum marinisediminis]|uniref:Peptidoglycan-binding protein n=1 Tax=Microbaculum marinisediminis TaxID=2931392 RepID=A0AAW5R1M5_9HYPH|nr:peptidoglycan-binding protein [Microbaculum sp. A6E488]MCT8974102.1 peptidoglycan-binding protein [Microbaculum sp. A6E488]
MSGSLTPAGAQDGILSPGDAIITQFSGLTTGPTGQPLPDPNGATVRANSMGNPGFPANGSVWPTPPVMFSLTARETGQVFGIAYDDAEPANAYVAATSVFGLYRSPTGEGWAGGMWGPGGGPGTVWKLDATNNYSPVPFSNLLGDDGTENEGPGLGGIAFDAWNQQLFVSDLQTGLIHRIALDSGETLQTFDHGLDGRSYFLDVPSGEYLVLDVIPDSEETTPRFDDCTDASGATARFEETPDCWNYADFRRRVFGLGVYRDPITDTVRLYYAVWGGAALGSDGWDTAGDDAATTIWSVLLDGNGGFDLTDVRREFIVPPLVPEVEGEGQTEAPAVTDIAFSSDGGMLLAERGRPAPDFDVSPPVLVEPDSARVLLFIRNEDGIWESEGRYDVGFPERGPDSPPHIRANAAGGVALGNGYTETGDLDPEAVDGTVWMSGAPLCAPNGPCIDRQSGQATVNGPISGFQGTPVANTVELVPPAAAQPGANTSRPATPPEGPLSSYMVADADGGILGGMGDIAIYRSEPVSQIVQVVEPTPEIVEELPPEALQPEAPLPDLAVAKTGLGSCAPGGDCLFEISVTNVGPVDYYGPIVLTDTISAPGVSLADAQPEPWFCYPADGNVYCQLPPATLAPGETTAFSLTLRLSSGYSDPRLNNCAAVTWLGQQGRDRIRAVQAGLQQAGFDPGSADGIMGPQTAAAIRAAEGAAGMAQTGQITPDLVDYLFGEYASQDGDASPANDQDCGLIRVDVPPPPAHLVQVSGFHRRFDSVNHNPATSAPYDFHDPELSFFHRTWRSSLHDATVSEPIPLHRVAMSQFHLTWGSAFHDSVFTQFVPLHSPALSVFHGANRSVMHDFRTTGFLAAHRFELSGFHRAWNSARHDGIVTRVAPLHWVQLSAFHRRFASGLHDRAVTRMRPLHNPGLSNFHNFNQSNLHDPLTSRVRPLHQPGLSTFHRNAISAQHNPATSVRRPGHLNNISGFHRSYASAQHVALTSRVRPLHGTGLSNFHRNNPSALHVNRTTQRLNQHVGTLSQFHRNNVSGLHNPTTSRARPTHANGISAFHGTSPSRLHNASTSRAAPVHAQGVSSFHRNTASGLHNSRTSNRVSPSHQMGLSNFHRSGKSTQHNNRTSGGVSPAHQPAVSSFHRNRGSAQHQGRTSKATTPSHNQVQSLAIKAPKQPVHAPAVSRAGKTPAHNPSVSAIRQQPKTPRQPAHNPSVSAIKQQPKAPRQPVHSPTVSAARQQPKAPKQPTHNPSVSAMRQQPKAPKQPAHNPVQSSARQQPKAPKQPAHNPSVSAMRQQPKAPKQPAHNPVQSSARQKPKAPKQPAHNPSVSAMKQQPKAPKQPAHNRSVSSARQKPKAPKQPTHNPSVSAMRQQPKATKPAPSRPARQKPTQKQQPRKQHDKKLSRQLQKLEK